VTLETSPGEPRVAGQGPGIPPQQIDRAFERFHLRSSVGGGSPDGAGLGLAIVRELTEGRGGTVAVENLPARGARFTVRLPGWALP
jgi:two-component system sensor histidine kinase TctE